MKALRIEYGSGYMIIDMEQFFPCTNDQMRGIVKKVIRLDYDHRDDLEKQIMDFLEESIPACEETYRLKGTEYFDCRQKASDCQRRVTEKKSASGVPLKDEEIKRYREDRDFYKKQAAEALRLSKKALADKKKFERNIEVLKTL